MVLPHESEGFLIHAFLMRKILLRMCRYSGWATWGKMTIFSRVDVEVLLIR